MIHQIVLLLSLFLSAIELKAVSNLSGSLESLQTLSADWKQPLVQETRPQNTLDSENAENIREEPFNNSGTTDYITQKSQEHKGLLVLMAANFAVGCVGGIVARKETKSEYNTRFLEGATAILTQSPPPGKTGRTAESLANEGMGKNPYNESISPVAEGQGVTIALAGSTLSTLGARYYSKTNNENIWVLSLASMGAEFAGYTMCNVASNIAVNINNK